MNKVFINLFAASVVLGVLSACSAIRADDWPSLHEGFELRTDTIAIRNELNIAPEMPLDPIENDSRISEILDLLEGKKASILADQQAFSDFMDRIVDAGDIGQQRHWFSAQIALSKLRDANENLTTMFAEADSIVERQGGAEPQPRINDAKLFLADLQDFIAEANQALNEKRPTGF